MNTKQRTQQDIETRKRLRPICDWFNGLNVRISGSQEDEGLSVAVIAEINAQNFADADLVAIRQQPNKWTRHDPYQWLWILHRYQNGYQKAIEQARKQGFGVVSERHPVAPTNPYDETKSPELHEAWENGAIEAGICSMYTNGVLDKENR